MSTSIERRLPSIPGHEMERLAAGITQLAATIIADADHQYTTDERIAAYMHCAATVNDVMKYVSRNYIEQPDLVELHAALGVLRAMLHAHGLVRPDGDRGDLEPC
jgi:hypothetical protein